MRKLFLASTFILGLSLLAPEAKADKFPGAAWMHPSGLPACVCPSVSPTCLCIIIY